MVALLFIAIACGDSEKSEKNSSSSIFKSKIDSPCEILSESEIKKALDIPSDAETVMKEIDRLYSMCKYKWPSEPFSGVAEIPGIVKTKEIVDQPKEMYITMNKDMTEEEFNKAISYYDDGVSQDGIGEMAKWSAKKRQVTFLKDGYMIHVYLRTSVDEEINKKYVIEIARLLAAEI